MSSSKEAPQAQHTQPSQQGLVAPLSRGATSAVRVGDRLFSGASRGAGLVVVAIVVFVGTFLVSQALPALTANQASFLGSTEWSVSGDTVRFGVAGLLWTTVASSILALVVAVPVGVAVALFLTTYSPTWLKTPAATLVDLLAAVPSIVYGLWGALTFVKAVNPVREFLQDHLGSIPLFAPTAVSGGTIFFIGLVLAIMILPIVTAISREVFAQTPRTTIEGALALGATKWEMVRMTILPFGAPGVVSASMLALGRALGETIAVTFIVSTLAPGSAWTWSLFNGGETFASKIANNAAEFNSPRQTGAYIAAGLVLFVLTLVVNSAARLVIERRKDFRE
jgi:phosphate transport system permease protein